MQQIESLEPVQQVVETIFHNQNVVNEELVIEIHEGLDRGGESVEKINMRKSMIICQLEDSKIWQMFMQGAILRHWNQTHVMKLCNQTHREMQWRRSSG